MSVSKEEMLAELDYLEGAALLPHSERTDAIRRLILAVEEWRKSANRALGDPDEKTLTRLLAEDIRDFGKKEK